MKTLKFASTKQALQHLADITNKRVKVADARDDRLWKAIRYQNEETVEKILEESKNSRYSFSNMALEYAVTIGNTQIIQMLLDYGFKPRNLIYRAFFTEEYDNLKDIIKMLLDAGDKTQYQKAYARRN